MFETAFLTDKNIYAVAEKTGLSAEDLQKTYGKALAQNQVVVISYIPPEQWTRVLETLPQRLEELGMTPEEFVEKLRDEIKRNTDRALEAYVSPKPFDQL